MSRNRLRREVQVATRRAVVGTLAALPLGGLHKATGSPGGVVVVTGPHRSGTTVMGQLLQHAPRTFLVHEPFNRDWGLARVPYRYPYLTATDADHPAARLLDHYLTSGEGQWLRRGKPLPTGHERSRLNRNNVRALRPLGFTPVVKDPFLLLSLGWLNAALGVRPVVTLRHPAAWVSSLRRRTMHPRAALASFRKQDAFGDPVVAEILARRKWERADLVSAGAATWACLIRMLDVQLAAGAQATVIRMEDFAADPTNVLLETYRACGLGVPRRLDRVVREYTGDHNIVTPGAETMHELRRNSSALVTAWRTQLSDAEQKTIRQITEAAAEHWYPTW